MELTVGTVYIIIQNYNDPTIYSSTSMKTVAGIGLSGTRVYTAVIPITVGNINTVLQVIANVVKRTKPILYILVRIVQLVFS